MRKVVFLLLAFLLVFVVGCGQSGTATSLSEEQSYKLELIKEVQAFEKRLGFAETENFKTYSDNTVSYDYTFYTPRTTLPYSLNDPTLKFIEGRPESIPDVKKYDTFFYAIQAIAGIKTPITKSLLEATLARIIFVVIHEDWHEQIDSTPGIEETSGEVVGYASAMLFAEEKFGKDSAVYNSLDKELQNKLKDSEVYLKYYDELSALYSSYDSGAISETETLSKKAELLEAMAKETRKIWGASPDQLNNAYIAFQMTYYRLLPLMYQVYSKKDFDLPKTLEILRSVPRQGAEFETVEELKSVEKDVTIYLQGVTSPWRPDAAIWALKQSERHQLDKNRRVA